jgi:hypothetical protein
MTDRTCRDCGADISGLHRNARWCLECRSTKKNRESLPKTIEPIAMSPLDLAYWAGLIDGEGHLGIRYVADKSRRPRQYIARFGLVMSEPPLVEAFAEQFSLHYGGNCSWDSPVSKKPLFRAQGAGQSAAAVAKTLLPYLRIKRRQAELLVQLEEEKRRPGLRTTYSGTYAYVRAGKPVMRKRYSTDQVHLDRWHEYFEEVRHLNKQGGGEYTPPTPLIQSITACDQDQVPVEPDRSVF